MFIDNPSKKLLLAIMLAATNIFSFAFGITIAREGKAVDAQAVVASAPSQSPAPAATKRAPAKPEKKAPAVAAPVQKPAAPVAQAAPALPIAGKGMWIYEFDKVGRGSVTEIVKAAKLHGLTHLYVRAGTSRSGLNTWHQVAKLLPTAHAAGLKVIAWYFPYLRDPAKDAARTVAVVRSVVHGHRVDGFAADIETPAEGTWLSAKRVKQYINAVRRKAPNAFMVLVPPRPNSFTIRFYPFHLVPRFDAVAPMVYWGGQDPVQATSAAVAYLKQFRRPIAPIGQTYDMGPEGGPKGRPPAKAIQRFMTEARQRGSVGVSFWSWQHSAGWQWKVIRGFPAWAA